MFYQSKFDPIRIVGQILLLQSSFYFTLGLLCAILAYIFNTPLHLALIFSSKAIIYHFPEHWSSLLAFTITIIGIIPFIVQNVIVRTRLCLDFVMTMFCIHWTLVFFYDGMVLPYGGMWYYIYYLVIIIICVVISEYLCTKRELEDIPLDFLSVDDEKTKKKTISGTNSGKDSTKSGTTSQQNSKNQNNDHIIQQKKAQYANVGGEKNVKIQATSPNISNARSSTYNPGKSTRGAASDIIIGEGFDQDSLIDRHSLHVDQPQLGLHRTSSADSDDDDTEEQYKPLNPNGRY